MKSVEYTCDVCGDWHGKNPTELSGYLFRSGQKMGLTYFGNSERHICNRCLNGLMEARNDLDQCDSALAAISRATDGSGA